MSSPVSRVAILSPGITFSGGDSVLLQVTRALRAGGAEVTWLLPAGRDHQGANVFADVAMQTVKPRGRLLAHIAMAWRGRCYDTVIAASPLLAALANLFARRHRTRVTWFLQGWTLGAGRGPFIFAVIRGCEAVLRHARVRTVVVSEALATQLPHGTLLRNGIDLQAFSPAPARRRQPRAVGSILSSGKLHLLPELLSARHAIARRNPDLEFRVLTPKPVRFGDGWTQDGGSISAADFLRTCDIFVSVSPKDGFALPPLEAMACAVPVIAVPSPGLLSYACHNQNALIAWSGRASDIAELVACLVASDELRNRLREAGFKTAEQHSLESAEQNYRRFFLESR